MNKIAFIALSLLFFTPNVFSQAWGEKVVWDSLNTTFDVYAKNVKYGNEPFLVTDLRVGNVYEEIESFDIKNMTIYRANKDDSFLENQPVIFFVHGGAWIDGYASMYDFVAKSFTGELGWLTVVIDYRLTSDSVYVADEFCPDRENCIDSVNRKKAAWYPDNIEDVADAFLWVKDSIIYNGGDVNNIFVIGHSAGGHLVSLFGTNPNYVNLVSMIKGIVSMSGVYDLKALNSEIYGSVLAQTYTGGYTNNDDQLDSASAISYINEFDQIPLFYVINCGLDLPSFNEQSIVFQNMLDSKGIYFENDFFLEYTHLTEVTALANINEEPTQKIISFIQNNITNNENYIPTEFLLSQNYPNPFNPSTTINYSIPANVKSKMSNVKLMVYDILGREIATLVNESQSAGNYEVEFNASNLSSGVYFYRLEFGNLKQIKKIMLIK